MRDTNSTVRKTVIAFSAVVALAGAAVAAPQIVSAAGEGTPSGRSVVDRADDHVREFQGRHHRLEARDDNGGNSGLDSPQDRAERSAANGRHLEPGDDRGNHVEPGDDHGNHVEPGDDHGGRTGGNDDSSGGGSDDSSGGGGDDSSGHGGGDD